MAFCPTRFVVAVNNSKTTGTGAMALSLARGLALAGFSVTMVVQGDGSLARAARGYGIEALWPLWRLPFCLRPGDVLVCHRSRDHLLSLFSLGIGVFRVRVWPKLHPPSGVDSILLGLTDLVLFSWHSVEAGWASEKAGVVYGGVDAAAFSTNGRRPGVFTVGMVSRLKPGRGHRRLIEASARLAARHRLLLVGNGELLHELQGAARELGVEPRLEMLRERVEDYPGLLSSFHALVYLSAGSDPSCRTVFEAMACGVPVVVAPVGDLSETCEGCGLVAEGEDLAAALFSMAVNPRLVASMGARGRERVLNRFTLKKKADRFVGLVGRFCGPQGEDSRLLVLQIISRKGCDSGGGLQALQLASALRSMGIDALFSARGEGSCRRRSGEMGVPFEPLPMRGEWDIFSLLSLTNLVRRRGIDLLHAHKGLAHSLSLGAALLLPSSPAVVANRGVSFPLEPWNRWRYRLPLTRGVVAVSHSVKGVLVSDGLSPEKVRVVHGSVDLDRFSPVRQGGIRDELGIPANAFVVGFVAAMRPWKNHLGFARLMAPLMAKHTCIHCVFAGGEKPKVRRALLGVVEEWGLSGRFHLLGYREDVERVMAACDLTVNLSTGGEGMPGVIRESLACGVPVVATPVAGNPEVVLHGHTGLLLGPGGEGLAHAVGCIATTPRLRVCLGKRGRRLVEQAFSVERRMAKMVEFYRQVLGREGN